MNIVIIVAVLFGLVIFFSFIYFITDFHKNEKFLGYVRFLGACAVMFTILAVIIQIMNTKEKVTADSITISNNLSSEIIDNQFKLFIEYPEMNYYYKELVGIDYNLPQRRNYILENQISMIIFSRISSIVYFIDSNKNYPIIDKKTLAMFENKFLRMLHLFFKSTIFQDNFFFYEKNLAGNSTLNYIHKHFSQYLK